MIRVMHEMLNDVHRDNATTQDEYEKIWNKVVVQVAALCEEGVDENLAEALMIRDRQFRNSCTSMEDAMANQDSRLHGLQRHAEEGGRGMVQALQPR